MERLIGAYGDKEEGYQLLCVAGMHGNEFEGIPAVERVIMKLHFNGIKLNGELTGLRGNISALIQNVRYIDRDLNRRWTREHLNELSSRYHEDHDMEDLEQRELYKSIKNIIGKPGRSFLLDLHATSAPGGGFTILIPGDLNTSVARKLEYPIVTGLEAKLDGTMMNYLISNGYQGLAFEGGQINDESTVDVHESAIWICLEALGCISESDFPELAEHKERLREGAKGLPSFIKMRSRKKVHGENFTMLNGYSNFQQVKKGEVLATENEEVVRAEYDGLLLMPLYQSVGEEGFFIAEEATEESLKGYL